ncbi:aldehyde oxidase GLOX1 [Malania oleifera]|uniref:aldehyde oxidase GLOX1 n=1 Tax=Malania oleifera TaxID=397392 RepID=UPI0025ADDB5D|nr:aldehyde oxidase GLOX1 [Malania oleifera]
MGVLLRAICLLPLLFAPSFGFFNPFAPIFGGRFGDGIGGIFGNGSQQGAVPGDGNEFETLSIGEWELATDNAGVSAMHLVLLPNTNRAVMFDSTIFGPSKVALPKGRCRPIPESKKKEVDCWAHSVEYDLDSGEVRPILDLKTDTWCSSGGLMTDGTLVQTGGWNDGGRAMRFLRTCDDCNWRENTVALTGQRWYATQQMLEDGSFVVVGGRRMFSYEFLPAEGKRNTKNIKLPFLQETSDVFENNLYPFVFLAPDGNLFMFANNRSILLDPHKNKILREFPVMPGGSRNYPASGQAALLPIKLSPGSDDITEEVLICGGARNDANFYAEKNKVFLPALQTCGRMEITAKDPTWAMEEMPTRRVMGDMLLLPTGDVLLINGAQDGVSGWNLAEEPNFAPVLYRPAKQGIDRFRVLKPSTIPRMYHSSSAVLPDGKILVAGSNTNSRYSYTGVEYPTELRVEKFSPPYLDPALGVHRPEIDEENAEKKVSYGQRFRVPFKLIEFGVDKEDVKVTMYSPPFTTHGFSQNQRLVQLGMFDLFQEIDGYNAVVEAPPSGKVAPPGYYLMFVVYRGVPSPGIWVQIK